MRPGSEDLAADTTAHYRAHWLRLLRLHLARARSGDLRADWRDEIEPFGAQTDRACRFGDAELLAVATLQSTPPAAWEPHCAGSWKQALASWFISARWVLMLEHELAQGDWPHDTFVNEGPRRGSGRGHRIDHHTYLACCDKLTASYLAGLAGGGKWPRQAWITWYRTRIEHWNNRGWADVELARLDDPAYCTKAETLPGYWRAG